MVGPSTTDEENRALNRKLKLGFVFLVGISGALIALQLNPTPVQLGIAFGASLLVGLVLIWYLSRISRQFRQSR